MSDDHRVLSLRSLPVVQPPGRILRIACEVVEGEVVSRSQLSSPPCSHGVQNEVTGVEIVVSLMPDVVASLHGNEECFVIGPTAPHRRPLVRVIRKDAVERKTAPPGTGDSGIIPEHTPRLRSIALITLVENVLGDLERGAVKGDRIGGGGELVGAVVTVVEQGGGSVRVHVEEAGLPELGVRVQQGVVGTSRSHESGCHLGVTSGTEVPVVSGLSPSTVGGDAEDAVGQSVVDGLAKEVFGDSSGVVAEDGKGTEGKTAVANTIPVTRDVARPPSIGGGGSIKDGLTRSQTVEDHVISHLLLLVVAQNVVKPIVTDGIGGKHLSGIQKVPGVPLVNRRTEVARGSVLQSRSTADRFRKPSGIPEFHPRLGRPTWCCLSSYRRRQKPLSSS